MINHKEAYRILIEMAKVDGLDKSKIDGYREKHHIIPKCVGGTDDDNNLVLLTAKEHYLCHCLLVHIYKDTEHVSKMICAFRYMSVHNSGSRIGLNDYSWMRELYSENHPMKRPEISEKVSKSLKIFYSNLLLTKEDFENRNKNISNSLKKYYENEENRQKASISVRKMFLENPEIGIKISNSLNEYYKNETEEEKNIRIEKRKETCISESANKKRSDTIKENLKLLSKEEMIDRMNKSARSCDHVARGKSISDGKKGKPTNQQQIMGEKYAKMSDDEFENFVKDKTRCRKLMTNLRNRYIDGSN